MTIADEALREYGAARLGQQWRGSVAAAAPTVLVDPPDGKHLDVPFPVYLNWPLPSQSTLKAGRASGAHMKAALDREVVKIPTDAMLVGSALHCCFLEPERMIERVVLWQGYTTAKGDHSTARRGKAWDEFKAQHADRIILTPGHYATMAGMVKALRRHPVVREWSNKIEAVEVSIVGEVEGVRCKARCDALTEDPLCDIKASRSADAATFTKTVLGFGYHIQAAMYRRMFGRDRFIFPVVEMTPPHDVVCYELSPAFLRLGEEEMIRMLGMYQEFAAVGLWPGRSEKVVQLEPPEWAIQSTGVTLGGVSFDGEDEEEPF